MKLKEFKDLVLEQVAEGDKLICETSKNIYYKYHTAPPFSIVYLDTRFVRREQYWYWNLVLKITSGHPYFRPWLSNLLFIYVQPLYTVVYDIDQPVLTLCGGCNEDEELSDILTRMEEGIIERVKKFERSLWLLDEISDRYKLQVEDISNYLNALHYVVKVTPEHNEAFFLLKENRRTYFPEQQSHMEP